MLNWNSIDHDRQHRAALLADAQQTRMARQALRDRKAPRPLRFIYAWTGRRLVTLGFSLLVMAREWEYRANTMYNEAQSPAQ